MAASNENTYTLSLKDMTVYVTYPNGETFDLNACGEKITTPTELSSFVSTLFGIGAFDETTAVALRRSVWN